MMFDTHRTGNMLLDNLYVPPTESQKKSALKAAADIDALPADKKVELCILSTWCISWVGAAIKMYLAYNDYQTCLMFNEVTKECLQSLYPIDCGSIQDCTTPFRSTMIFWSIALCCCCCCIPLGCGLANEYLKDKESKKPSANTPLLPSDKV